MKKRQIQALGLIAVAILIVISALVYELAFTPVIVEGVVEWKGITGVKDNTHSTIITNRPSEGEYRILVRDKNYKGFFRDIGNAEVNESLEDKLKADYSNLNYYVEITVDSSDPVNNLGKGYTYGYSVSREDFNKVQVWDKVKCEVSRWSELPRIKILEVDRVEWVGLLFRVAEKDERVRELIEGKSYKVVIGSRTSKNYGEEFVMVGGKPYKIAIYLNNETVKSVEEVKDEEQLRMIQEVIRLQNEINITVEPHEREKK
jgi:hypothetical protein